MTDTPATIDTDTTVPEAAPDVAPVETVAVAESAVVAPAKGGRGEGDNRDRGRRGARGGRPRERAPRERSEFDQATIDVRRVARVMAGGRRFSFSVVIVLGDRKGRVGVGIGKGADTALAIEKATRNARRNIITVPLTKDNSISHSVETKYASSTIIITPSPGRGLVAGSAMRTVLELGGIGNVIGKILTRSKNKLTIARATVAALKKVKAR